MCTDSTIGTLDGVQVWYGEFDEKAGPSHGNLAGGSSTFPYGASCTSHNLDQFISKIVIYEGVVGGVAQRGTSSTLTSAQKSLLGANRVVGMEITLRDDTDLNAVETVIRGGKTDATGMYDDTSAG